MTVTSNLGPKVAQIVISWILDLGAPGAQDVANILGPGRRPEQGHLEVPGAQDVGNILGPGRWHFGCFSN